MGTRPNPSMSDRRLRALLKQLRETPAAPQDFRAKVLDRLADDGILRSAPLSKPAWTARVSGWLRPASLGLAACGALALALLFRPQPLPLPAAAEARPRAPLAKPAPSVHPLARPQAVAVAVAAPPARAEQAPAVAVAPQPPQAPAAGAVGVVEAPKSELAVVHVAGVTATQGPEPRGGSKPFPTGGSEVRNNVVRVSQGQPSDVHFSFITTGHVRVDILDRLGRVVSVLYDGTLTAGEYDGNGAAPLVCTWCLWNDMTDQGATAASGIYLVRIQTPDYVHIHKLMLIK